MRYFLFILFIFQLGCSPTIGQNIITKKNAPKKILNLYKEAQDYSRNQSNIGKAIIKLEKLIKKEPQFLDARLLLGTLYIEKHQLDKGILEYKEVIKIDPKYKSEVHYALARAYEKNDQFEKAISSYNTYINQTKTKPILVEKSKKAILNITFKKDALNNPVVFNPVVLPDMINTKDQEYLPFITADGLQMVFTRRVQDENFYFTNWVNGQWSMPQYLEEINTNHNEGAHTLSPDGKTLYYTLCDDKVTYGSCDLYYAYKINNHWSEPKNLGSKINSEAWDTQPTVSADGRTMYFISKRKGGYGGADIWISKKKRGQWQNPVNAGPILNTSQDEITPFLHPDGQTIYFASEGHPGMGGKDIFYSRKDKKGNWTTPINIGYPINTENHEGDLFVDLKGEKAYFASDNEHKGNIDIYSFDLPIEAKPQKVLFVKGTVKDKLSRKTIESYIKINQVGGVYAAKVKTDRKGDFLICLPVGHEYTFNVAQKGYLFYSERLILPSGMEEENIKKDIDLSKITPETKEKVLVKNEPIILNNVLFKSGSYKLLSVSTYELNNLVQLLKDLPDTKIIISGHTDNIGDNESNLLLSTNRAKAVLNYLVKKGIDISRLESKGFGESQPIESNDTDVGRQRNRRTTFEIKN